MKNPNISQFMAEGQIPRVGVRFLQKYPNGIQSVEGGQIYSSNNQYFMIYQTHQQNLTQRQDFISNNAIFMKNKESIPTQLIEIKLDSRIFDSSNFMRPKLFSWNRSELKSQIADIFDFHKD